MYEDVAIELLYWLPELGPINTQIELFLCQTLAFYNRQLRKFHLVYATVFPTVL